MIFFEEKYYFVLEISRFLCFCEIHRFYNLRRHHGHCYVMEVTIKMKFDQILVCCKRNISRITSSRSFHDLIKMTLMRYLEPFQIFAITRFFTITCKQAKSVLAWTPLLAILFSYSFHPLCILASFSDSTNL